MTSKKTATSYKKGDTIIHDSYGGGCRRINITQKTIMDGKPGFFGVRVNPDGSPKLYNGEEIIAWGYDINIIEVCNR
ncbi:hypothetical protein KAR91_50440 [Candidatus Pacearchaeota archaeon]|nr:hypothetical protein [Candidatus Pacearchaeota archaeon]